MISLDTNVLIRLLTGDDPEQARIAAEAMRSGELWLAKTVVLELVWVLGYTYGFERADIAGALTRLLGLEHLRVEDEDAVISAVQGYEQGLDFADALHLASSCKADSFITFDRKLAARAQQVPGTAVPVRLLGTRSDSPQVPLPGAGG